MEVFQGYAKETTAEGKLFNVVLTLYLWVNLSSKNRFLKSFSSVLKKLSLETTSPSSLYPDTGLSKLLSKLFNKTNQILGAPEIVIHFPTLSIPLHAKTKKSKKIPRDRHLKSVMVTYVEKDLCRIKISLVSIKFIFISFHFEIIYPGYNSVYILFYNWPCKNYLQNKERVI